MVDLGAKISAEERTILLDYLSATYGPGAPGGRGGRGGGGGRGTAPRSMERPSTAMWSTPTPPIAADQWGRGVHRMPWDQRARDR